MDFVTAYGPKKKVGIHFDGPGRTKQSHRDECDINKILARFQKTGVLEFVNEHGPQYGDVTGVDFQRSMDTVAKGKEIFADLPSKVRNEFDNDPQAFFEFVSNPDNTEEMVRLGLIEAAKPDAAPEEPKAKDPEEPAQPEAE